MIDEKKLIEHLQKCVNASDNANFINGLLSAIDIVKLQPQSSKWIPCKERLPEDNCGCLIAWRHKGQTSAQVRKNTIGSVPHYYEIAFYNVYRGWSELRQGDDIEVIAWMPLPEPYEEEQNYDGRKV